MLTLVLQYLLVTGRIDAAVVVGPAEPYGETLFTARLVRSLEELDSCAGSKYYPVEFSSILREIQAGSERIAVVGLPCHISGVRAVLSSLPRVRMRVRYLFGLVCGHGVSTVFTDFVTAAAGAKLDGADRVAYRTKRDESSATEFSFTIEPRNGKEGRALPFPYTAYGAAWSRRLFVPRSCDFCEDVFAVDADASFMDAWLPRYMKDPKGTSLVISRRQEITDMLTELVVRNEARLWEVNAEDILASQQPAVHWKRDLLPDRVYTALARCANVPPRLAPFAVRGTPAQHRLNTWRRRDRAFSSLVWSWRLPPRLRIALILFGTEHDLPRRVLRKASRIARRLSILSFIAQTKEDGS
jgi:coenzyme F420-reducing hydrogenase beta subunit